MLVSLLQVRIHPDPGKLPGGPQIQQLLDGLGGWALLAGLGGLLVSVIVWAMGSFGGEYRAVAEGETGVSVCTAAAVIACAAAPIINFCSSLGAQIHRPASRTSDVDRD